MTKVDRFLEARPRRAAGLRLDRRGHGFVLADDGRDRCEMNETAAAVWELCDGETTVAEMVGAVCLACNVDRDDAVEDLRRVVVTLASEGFVEWRVGTAAGSDGR